MRCPSLRRQSVIVLLSLFLAAANREVLAQTHHSIPSRTPPACPIVLTGEVFAGQSFRAPINSSLRLQLDPVPHGWILRVLPATGPSPAEDMAALATPPFRSINPLLLTTDFGLRAQDLVGWNPRSFHYLRRRADLPAAEAAFKALVSTSHPKTGQQRAVVRVAGNAAEGRLDILDARLTPGIADQTPAAALVATHFLTTAHTILPASSVAGPLGRVEWLRFRVTLDGQVAAPGRHCP